MSQARIMAVALTVCALGSRAAVPDVADNFDTYPAGQLFVSPVAGWQASSNTVMVTNNAFVSSPQSVVVARQTTLTNTVNGGGDKVIWTDCCVKPVSGEQPPDLPVGTASLVAFFDTNGYLEVATSLSGWTVCSNDIWANPISSAGTEFVRVSVCQNYSASNMAVFVNKQLAIQDLRFVGSSAAYNTFSVMSPSSNAWLDNVWIKTNYDAATLNNDLNGDGMLDAEEVARYGYASRTFAVGTSLYPTILSALAASRARDRVSIPSGTYAEDVVVSNAVTFVGGIFTNTGTLRLQAGVAPVFSNAMKWGTVEVASNMTATLGQTLVCSNLVIRSGAMATVQNVTCSNLIVETNARLTCLGTMVCGSSGSVDGGAVAAFSNAFDCVGSFSVAAGATVTLGDGGTLGALTADGSVVVGAGKTLAATSAAVSGGVQVSGSGTVSIGTTLSVTGSGTLTFTDSRLSVPASNVDMTGSFTINTTWGQPGPSVPLKFADDFERYPAGTRMADVGFTGWGATDPAVAVQETVANSALGGSKALLLPAGTIVSNRIATTAKKIWTDCYLRPALGGAPFNPPTNTAGFVAFVDTNGWLEVATPGGWTVCSNLVAGGEPDRMTASGWTRVTVCQNLTNNTVAVFVNGKLVRQLLAAPGTAPAAYTSFAVNSQDDPAYLDDVVIDEAWPTSIKADLDRDLAADAYEVDQCGSMTLRRDWVPGIVFSFR